MKKTKQFSSALFLILFFWSILFSKSLTANTELVSWELAQTWGNEHLLGFPTTRLAELVNELSDGKFTISLVSSSDHGNSRGIFDFVREGRYEMGHSASNFWAGKDPKTNFFSAVPFGMITPELYSWFYESNGLELMNKVYQKHGLMSFPGGNSGHQMIGWFNREINTIKDIEGLKIRLPGLAGEVMKGLGAEIINPPVSELKSALQNGKVDAVEFVGPAIDLNLGLAEVSKFYYIGWHSPSSEMQFLVNPKAYEQLSEHNKSILKHAMKLAAYDTFTKIVYENGQKMIALRSENPNLIIRSFPTSVLKALKKEHTRLTNLLIEQDQEGLTKEIVESMHNHIRVARLWTRFSDQAYLFNVSDL